MATESQAQQDVPDQYQYLLPMGAQGIYPLRLQQLE